MHVCVFQYSYSAAVEEYRAAVTVRRRGSFQIDSPQGLHGKSDTYLIYTV